MCVCFGGRGASDSVLIFCLFKISFEIITTIIILIVSIIIIIMLLLHGLLFPDF